MLQVETGTGTNPLADSFGTLVDARAWAALYGYALPVDDTAAEVAMRKGAVYVGTNPLSGSKLVSTQPLSVPRAGVTCDGETVEVAEQLTAAFKAQIIYASSINDGLTIRGNDTGRQVKSNKVVGAVEQEFFESSSSTTSLTVTEAVDALACLLSYSPNAGSSFTFKTIRS